MKIKFKYSKQNFDKRKKIKLLELHFEINQLNFVNLIMHNEKDIFQILYKFFLIFDKDQY